MKLAKKDGVTYAVAKEVRRSVGDCHAMFKMLSSYAALGKTVVVVENGIRVTKCPPAYARGVWPDKNVGMSGKTAGRGAP